MMEVQSIVQESEEDDGGSVHCPDEDQEDEEDGGGSVHSLGE